MDKTEKHLDIIKPGEEVLVNYDSPDWFRALVFKVIIGLDNRIEYEISYWDKKEIKYLTVHSSQVKQEKENKVKHLKIGFYNGETN